MLGMSRVQHVLNLANKCVRHFNHFVFTKLCCDFNVVPKGLSLKKNPCVGNLSSGAAKQWNDTLEDGGRSLVHILYQEHWRKFEVSEREFWNSLVLFLEKHEQESATKDLDSVVREINSLMSSLKRKRTRKFRKLISVDEQFANKEKQYLEEIDLLKDLLYVRAPLSGEGGML